MSKQFLVLSLFVVFSVSIHANNLRKIVGSENLLSSTVTSLYQDKRGLMWIGTSNGLNLYNGRQVTEYHPSTPGSVLVGSQIAAMTEAGEDILWVNTYHGLNRIRQSTGAVELYPPFNRVSFATADSSHNLFAIQGNGSIYYYQDSIGKFDQSYIRDLAARDLLLLHVAAADHLWILKTNGSMDCFTIHENPRGDLSLESGTGYTHDVPLIYAFSDGDQFFFIDRQYRFYRFDPARRTAYLLADLQQQLAGKGIPVAAVRSQNHFFFGFREEGLYLLRKEEGHYAFEKVPFNAGVTCLLKDRYQDILWIGTPGQGVYTYSHDPYIIRSTLLSNLTPHIRKPVTALFLDSQQTLWVGSNGDGLLQIPLFDPYGEISEHPVTLLTSANSALQDNTIHAIAGSRHPILWVGTETGLHAYSLQGKRLMAIPLSDGDTPIRYIHAVYEQDSVLWIASAGQGVVKAGIRWTGDQPVLTVRNRFTLRQEDFSSNRFTTIYPENDTTLWFTNKGEGVFRMHTPTFSMDTIRLEESTLSEVNVLVKYGPDSYLMGTNFGLVRYTREQPYVYNEASGFPNNTVHSILRTSGVSCWLGTNRGIVYVNPDAGTFRVFNHLNGLQVTEFSDGAAWQDPQSGVMLFGGVNGFVSIPRNREPYDEAKDYLPPVTFDQLTIAGEDYNIHDFLLRKGNTSILELPADRNFFAVSFTALDYINGNNYTYYYRLEGANSQWIDNGNSSSVSFTNLAPGRYKLYVKYYNKILLKESFTYSLDIRILSPWYRTGWAFAAYVLIGLSLFVGIAILFVSRTRKKRTQALQALEQQHKEEIYEAKLQFFTHIAHEFCTPLTLIYGPCERILGQKNLEQPIVRYARVIRQNAKRLNALIQDLLAFQRMETGYEKPQVQRLPVSTLTNQVADMFAELTENQHIRFDRQITPDISWPSDEKFMVTILSNLLSNAFKYTTQDGHVAIRLEEVDNVLHLTISNTGKGIHPEDMNQLFNRHTILQRFEYAENTANWSRNGLGLAISHQMISLLDGTVEVESEPGEWTHFSICFPRLEDSTERVDTPYAFRLDDLQPENNIVFPSQSDERNETRPTILVIDDDAEMRWFIGELFTGEFNVLSVGDPTQVADILAETQPDVILCDIMMEQLDGITLAKTIKSDERTAHIPLIIISARHEIDLQIEAIGAGAELYIAKPFNVDYLKTSVRQLMERKEILKDYFASPLSAFELANGKLTHREHKKLLKDIISIINRHIRDKELNVNLIASELHLSVRSLYRKLEETDSNIRIPDLIRDCRVNKAADLLIKSRMTTDEIISHSGFSNRASFYRAFTTRFHCTPTEYKEKGMNGPKAFPN